MKYNNYALSDTFTIKYGKSNSNSYSMVDNGDICLSSFQDIYKPNFKVIADSANIAGAVSNNFGVLLAKSLTANGTDEEKNEAEKLKFYYYEFFVSRIGAAPFRGTGSSIKKSASDTGNDGMAYRIYGCGIRNGVGLEPMVVPLESVMVLPK